ncbi:MAG: hypothetical protein A3E83_08645 [Gammaproteobacteria bacterium RIFCSPHIGHO2_12_FULL_41_20]|nr:MAG: hypothetical protein A3E83_08645 [Gammaproteobacteria bacterium RIFCSPHIGHO2_12_FULL_41_20]
MEEIYNVYDALSHLWGETQKAFFSYAVIGAAEAALTAVDGQCCKNGLSSLDVKKAPIGGMVYFAGGGISRRRSPMWRVAPLGNLWIQKQRRMGAHAATLRCIVNTPSALSMTTGCNSCFANLA